MNHLADWTWADGQLASYTGSAPDTCVSACNTYEVECGNPNDDCTSVETENERDFGVD